ncbi:chemotaxis protein MotB [Humidesulfovibrio mexicanus]|uniref:Chemotaxis protein MotB n=1 Tax=Humidesulfovibrio mexicanus TaxID=147047 RepID=A0A238XWT6_9BACT|nr:flagellar motor protein MotB [Humidesulfovibrio mexicanus]SNR63038.1 chemotaxis protein MotB [Humidesulfovibrio mexicanus]
MSEDYEREEEEEQSDSAEWLITFSDLTMLLLVFFIMLYAMSTPDPTKVTNALQAVTQALSGKESKLATSTISREEAGVLLDQVLLNKQIQIAQQKVFSDVKYLQTKKGLEGLVGANFEDGVITIRAPGDVLFASGDVTLTPKGREVIEALKDFFAQHPDQTINIRGYTDDRLPMAGSRFRDNWEVSSLRAVNVLRVLMEMGIEPKRLTSTGLADINPLFPNTTDEYRAQNRRVEFVLEKRVTGK